MTSEVVAINPSAAGLLTAVVADVKKEEKEEKRGKMEMAGNHWQSF